MPKLSINAIKDRIADLQKKLVAAENSKAPAIKKIKELMKKLGVTLTDLASHGETTANGARRRGRPPKTQTAKEAKSKKSRRSVAIKYRDDKGNTWTGRGKTPRWLVEAEKAGKGRDAFKI